MIKPIEAWDLPDTTMVPDGYDMRNVPAPTWENLEYIIERHNELVGVVNDMTANREAP